MKKSFGFHANYSWRNVGFAQTDLHPVVCVSWNDAVAFCDWLSRKEGKTYRLPTEAEWEYACRAGTTTRYWCGDDPEGLARAANVPDASAKSLFPAWKTIGASDGCVFTAPVGSYRPNPFGLYDMHGNAWQWCSDWAYSRYYEISPPADSAGARVGEMPCLSRRRLELRRRTLSGGQPRRHRTRPSSLRSGLPRRGERKRRHHESAA